MCEEEWREGELWSSSPHTPSPIQTAPSSTPHAPLPSLCELCAWAPRSSRFPNEGSLSTFDRSPTSTLPSSHNNKLAPERLTNSPKSPSQVILRHFLIHVVGPILRHRELGHVA